MKSATKLRVMCLVFGLGVIQAKPLEDSEVKRYNSNVSDFHKFSHIPKILAHTDSTPFTPIIYNSTVSINQTERSPKTFHEISNFVYNAIFGDSPPQDKSNEKDSHNIDFKNHNSKIVTKSQNKKHKTKSKIKNNKNTNSTSTKQEVSKKILDKQKLDQLNTTQTLLNKTGIAPQPVLHIIISRWPEKSSANNLKHASNLKQGWEDYGIPIPNPQPEVIPENPSGSLGSSIPQIALQGQDLQQVSSNLPNIISHSAITLAQAGESGINPCPSVQIGSSVFGPSSARQGCPDLNIAFNTHLNGNLGSNRIPTANQYDTVPVEPEVPAEPPADIGAPLADPVVADPVAADPVVADPAPLADPAPGAPATGGTQGGTGGLPSIPEFPSFPELPGLPEFPEFGEFFGMMGGLLRILWSLLGNNPMSPLAGMMMFGSLFPWWLPYLFLGGSNKSPEPEVTYYDHYYPPIKHYDGWNYNHNINSWKSAVDRRKPKAYDIANTFTLFDVLNSFIEKNSGINNNHTIISWKRRKK